MSGPGPQDPQVRAALQEVEREMLARATEDVVEPSLDRIRALVDLLGDPQDAAPVVHVTGTNGKTSTARMVDALLTGFGLRTGRFTSPHLRDLTERIALEGSPIEPARLIEAWRDVAPYVDLVDARGGPRMSFFEVVTGTAFAAFADAPVDAVVLEVGMGGSWDATNVADGRVAVVTPVALDHVQYLGPDLTSIATEKAGIIKPGSVAVLARQHPEAAEVLRRRAAEVGAQVVRENEDFAVVRRSLAVGGQVLTLRGLGGEYDEVFLPLHGEHQAYNAVVALAAVEAFLGGGETRLDVDVVRAAFASVTSPGRLEVVRSSPTIVLDAAHNPAGARTTAAGLREAFAANRFVGVVSVLADKDVRGVLEALEPVLEEIVVSRTASSRAMDPDELAAIALEVFDDERVQVVPRLDDAIEVAVTLAEEISGQELAGAVLVTGSVVAVGEARTLLGGR